MYQPSVCAILYGMKRLGIAAVIISALLGPSLAACSTAALDDSPGFTAEVMCEEFVKDRLKSPATADFSEQSHVAQGASWKVTGAVDSENSFGAKVRSAYVCVLRNTEGDTWKASKVQVIGQ